MVRIAVSPDQLLDVARFLITQRQELERMCQTLDKQIYFVREGWSGATKERFFQEYLVARQSMDVTILKISFIAEQLNFIARSFAEADESGGTGIVMPSLPPKIEANLKNGVDFTGSAIKGVGATVEGILDDLASTGMSLWENPLATAFNMGYALTVGKVIDVGMGLHFAWDYTWGSGSARGDVERFTAELKQDIGEKGTGYYSGYIVSQAAAYLTIGKALKKSHAKHDDLGGSGGKSRTEGVVDNGLKLKTGYDTHLIEVEDVVRKGNKGIVGGHNLDNFNKAFTDRGWSLDENIISKTPHSTINGVYEVKYQLPMVDTLGNIIPGQYKNIPNPKTVYDPSVISNEQLLQWGREAMANGTVNGRIITGTSSNGLKFQGYIDNGEISNFFPTLK